MALARQILTSAVMATLLAAAPAAASAQLPPFGTLEMRIRGEEQPWGYLSTVGSVTVGDDATLYVSQPREHTIRMFDADGRFQRVIGRRGDGPGEFRRLGRLGFIGDTLYALDAAGHRLHFFDPEGDHVSSVALPELDLGDSHGEARAFAVIAGPRVLAAAAAERARRDVPAGWRGVPVVIADLSGADPRTVGWRTSPRSVLIPPGRRGLRVEILIGLGPYFDDYSLSEPLHGGSGIIAVDREIPTTPGTSYYTVTRLDARGDTVFSRRVPYEPIAVDDRTTDSLLVHSAGVIYDGATAQVRAREVRRIREQLGELPRFRTPVLKALAGIDGTAWVRETARTALGQSWLVLAPDGSQVGRILLPNDHRLVAATRDRIWTVSTDDLDVPSINRYRIRLQ